MANRNSSGGSEALLEEVLPRVETALTQDETTLAEARLLLETDPNSDQRWIERASPRFEAWLDRLQELEGDFQSRVANFLRQCRLSVTIPELHDKYSQMRLERTWSGVTDYFESVMPDELLGHDSAKFSIDTETATAWWTAGSEERGLPLDDIILRCLRRDGEMSLPSAQQLVESLVTALQDGTAPLPGFVFLRTVDSVAMWQWLSPDVEASAKRGT